MVATTLIRLAPTDTSYSICRNEVVQDGRNTTEREPVVSFRRDLPLTHEHVAPVVSETVSNKWSSIMISESCRWGRKHLRLHKTRDGKLYVRVGRRGSGKMIIDRCDVTYLDGEPTFHHFKFAKATMNRAKAPSGWQSTQERRAES